MSALMNVLLFIGAGVDVPMIAVWLGVVCELRLDWNAASRGCERIRRGRFSGSWRDAQLR
jgi:hypothetical protein